MQPAFIIRMGAVLGWGVLWGISGCAYLEPLPSSSAYWERKEVPYSQVITDYNVCKIWSTVKYAESEKREDIITDNLGYWIHVPLLKECMEHKGYTYVGPMGGTPLYPQ